MKTQTKQTAAKKTPNPDVLVTPSGKKLSLSLNTIAGVGRSGILAGQSNAEVTATLAGVCGERFPAEKRAYYARWYRAQLVMLGVIDAEDPRASNVSIRRGDDASTKAERQEAKQESSARRAKRRT